MPNPPYDAKDPRWRGIHRHGSGWRAAVSHGRGRPKTYAYFPIDTPLAVMQAWRADEQAAARVKRKRRASRGTFAGDAPRYLDAVKAMPTYKERARDIALWVECFGDRRRDTITSTQIRAECQRWLTEPRGVDADGTPLPPLSPHTVNLRLRALSNLFTVLDGPRADNPARDVDEAEEPETAPRDLDYPTIACIIAAMPDRGRAAKGQHRSAVSLTKIRVRILAYSGLPPATLKRVRPEDVDLDRAFVTLSGRRKGKGTASAILPLLPLAVEAFRDLLAANGCGPFSTSSLYKSFMRAARHAKVSNISPYALRHSFATTVYDLTEDEHLVMALLMHSSLKTSETYRRRAIARVLQRKTARLGRHFGTTPQGRHAEFFGKRGTTGTAADPDRPVERP
jgi:integrase